ncbi:unnamed protein product [Knipowitschia caucasica]|uniref:Uncharacterized protein n=1 Tax=Knipowitschia caucasica TaxID=637954 RepID=A0AAV2KFF2_KNICA
MNVYNVTRTNFTGAAHLYVPEEPLYKQYKPPIKELVPLPKAVIYLLMAALVVVGVAYAIVGHLIKDLAIDIAECVLGPHGDEDKESDTQPCHHPSSHPPVHPFAHNAFHVWDPEDVMVSLPPEESPQVSPMLLAAIHMPHFFPNSHSPTSSLALTASPGDKDFGTHTEF